MSETKTSSLRKVLNETIEENTKQSDRKRDEEFKERLGTIIRSPNHPLHQLLNPKLFEEFGKVEQAHADSPHL